MNKDAIQLISETINAVQYEENALTILYDKEKVIFGALINDSPEWQKFFSLAIIYKSIIDIDKKIKLSILDAAAYTEEQEVENWDPFQDQSENEWKATYHIENAIYRTETLWDLLAQWFNIIEKIDKPNDRVYPEQLFHDAQQGKKPNLFAKRVYAHMTEEAPIPEEGSVSEEEAWKGSYTFIKNYRDKMTHRNAPSITSIADYSVDLKLPAYYVLMQLIDEYLHVSDFIHELVSEFTDKLPPINKTEEWLQAKNSSKEEGSE